MRQFLLFFSLFFPLCLVTACGNDNSYHKYSPPPEGQLHWQYKLGTRIFAHGVHSPFGLNDLPMRVSLDARFNATQIQQVQNVFDHLSEAAGTQLFKISEPEHPKDWLGIDSLKDETSGIYMRKCWDNTFKHQQVLGSTFWENRGRNPGSISTFDIHLNFQHYQIVDSLEYSDRPESGLHDGKEIVDFETLLLHELGHAIGLAHPSEECAPDSVMLAKMFIGVDVYNRTLGNLDRANIAAIYGQGDFPIPENCEVKAIELSPPILHETKMNDDPREKKCSDF